MTQGIKQWLYKASAAEMLKATKEKEVWSDMIACAAKHCTS